MPDTTQAVPYYSIALPNKAGEGARLLSALQAAGVNLIGLWGYPIKKRKAQVDLVPGDVKAFKAALKRLGVEAGQKRIAFHISGEDHPGVLVESLTRLAGAGISVWAAQAICAGQGRFGALLQVAPEDEKKAGKVLGAK